MSAPSPTPAPLQIGLVLFPKVTQLDFTGPLQVFSSLPGAGAFDLETDRAGHEPIPCGADVEHDLCGLPAARRHLRARRVRHRRHGQRRGDAGLPAQAGRWCKIHHLGLYGLTGARRRRPSQGLSRGDALDGDGFSERVRRDPDQDARLLDRNRVTGGGVTAGIDFALTLVSLLDDQKTAEAIQLRLEYNPAPPFNAGSPDTAPPEVLAIMKERIAPAQVRRGEIDRPRRRAADVSDRAVPRSGTRSRHAHRKRRKRPPGFPDGLSCPTAATH